MVGPPERLRATPDPVHRVLNAVVVENFRHTPQTAVRSVDRVGQNEDVAEIMAAARQLIPEAGTVSGMLIHGVACVAVSWVISLRV